MASTRVRQDETWLLTLIAVVLVVAVLWAARIVLLPLAVAILLAFLLAPICERLEKWGVGRVISVMTVTLLIFVLMGVIGWIVAGQIIDLAGQLPEYRQNIREKLDAVRLPAGGPLSRATEGIRQVTDEILRPPPEAAAPDPLRAREGEPPVPMQVVPDPQTPVQRLMAAFMPLLLPLASAGIVIVFVIFILLQRDDLRDRILRLIGQGRLTVATQAIDDAARRVSRYLLMLLLVNASYGVAAGVGLYFIGLPNALLWGVLATLVRFIPYVGPWIGALLPITFSLAVFEHWTPVVITVSFFVILELISNNVMEPLLYGTSTGISPVAVIVSAVFWAWLWGPVGLMLAMPLTVCVVVIGRYIPRMEFLSVLLSDEPGLPPAARLYQRLLALDQDDVYELAESHLSESSLLDLHEQLLLPALALAERDRHHGKIDAGREQGVYETLRDIVSDLGERQQTPQLEQDEQLAEEPADALSVLCIPARDVADEIACLMLVQLLRREGMLAEIAPPGRLISELLDDVAQRRPDALCISALPPQALVRAKHLCQKLTDRFPDLRIVVGMWNVTDIGPVRRRIDTCSPDRVVSTLSDAIAVLRG